MTLMVNPELLRGFASKVDTASAVVSTGAVGQKVAVAADGLPASTTQWAARMVGEHVTLLQQKIAENLTAMGIAVRGAGDRFEASDDALAGAFGKLFD